MKTKELINKIKESKILSFLKETLTLGGNSKYAPASLTFYIFLSLVPIVTIVLFLLSLLGYQMEDLLNYLQTYLQMDDDTLDLLLHYFSNIPSSSKTVFRISFLVLIYLSSKGIYFFTYAYSKINKTNMKYLEQNGI